jgi:Rnl2 family RNA ligase
MHTSTPWLFTSYEKISDSPQQWGLDPAGFRALEKARWVVTEKIHGANFCFVVDGSTVRCANRRQFLASDDLFFGYERVLARLRARVLAVAALVRQRIDTPRVAIYGELFGGAYPHPDVPPDPSVQPVQTGVFYAPGVEFCAFDIAVAPVQSGTRAYLDYELVLDLCHQAGLLVSEPLQIGSYSAAMAYPVGFNSTIPRQLGLPPLDTPNLAEGVVIKPVEPMEVAGARGLIRPVLKKKIPTFVEDQRYAAAQPWPAQPAEYYSTLDALQWAAFNMVTANRLQNAISKIGMGRRGDGRHKQRLFRMLVDDVLEQLGVEHLEALVNLDPMSREQLMRSIHRDVRELLRQRFQHEAL